MEGAIGARLSLTARAAIGALSISPRRRVVRTPPPRPTGPYALLPPRNRLQALRRECSTLDRELKVLENSGHSRVGVFTRPLATQMQSCDEAPPNHTYANDAVDESIPEAEEECRDPFYHQFYDDEGRSLFEQFLRARMRGLALAKLAYGARTVVVARAEVELAEAYARLNLWKQGYPHIMIAKNILKTHDEAQNSAKADKEAKEADDPASRSPEQASRHTLLSKALSYFYDLQGNESAQGQVGLAALTGYVQLWQDELQEMRGVDDDKQVRGEPVADEIEMEGLFSHDNLVRAFDGSPMIHWQKLMVRLERDSEAMRGYISQIEKRVQPEAMALIQETFAALDSGRDGIVSQTELAAAIDQQRLKCRLVFYQTKDGSGDDKSQAKTSRCLGALANALRHKRKQVEWPTVTWCELLELSCAHRGFVLGQDEASDTLADEDESDDDGDCHSHLTRVLDARIELFLGRLFLRRGQLDDAVRSIHVAIATQEQTCACNDTTEPSDTLVPFYLAAAEILGVRSKQLRARSHQVALDQTERWLQTPEGTRSVRARALSIIDTHYQRSGGHVLTKKDAEAQAISQLRQERIQVSVGLADASSSIALPPEALALLDEAVEYCNKAWSLLEQHLGREHVATAAVHSALAQLHLTKGETDESVRCYARAVAVYEAACNGPVPASALVQLEIARIHHQRAFQLAAESQSSAASSASAARHSYLAAAKFFQSFGREFPGVSSTRRECCVLALDALRQWLLLARAGEAAPRNTRQQLWPVCPLEEQRSVLARIHEIAVDGYGEFSIEASDAARELAKTLGRLGGDVNASAGVVLLRSALVVYESHFGAADRRSRQVRKEVQHARQCLSSSGKEDELDGGEWLTL